MIAATFTHFLLKNIGGSETFKDKQDFFYHEIRKFHQKHHHEKLQIKIHREKLLESSIKATKNFSVSDWCRNFEITFHGEQGCYLRIEHRLGILIFRTFLQIINSFGKSIPFHFLYSITYFQGWTGVAFVENGSASFALRSLTPGTGYSFHFRTINRPWFIPTRRGRCI